MSDFRPDDAVLADLSGADALALEALVEAGWDLRRVPDGHRERAQRIAGMLGMLTGGPGMGSPDAVVAAVRSRLGEYAGREGPAEVQHGWIHDDSGLSEEDVDALEALVAHRLDPAQAPSGVRERAKRQAEILAVLGTPLGPDAAPTAEDREALIQRTLGAVRAEVDGQSVRMRLDPRPVGRGWRMADLVSMAAVLVIGAMVLVPVVSGARENQRRAACTSNFAEAGFGFASYAGDFRSALPMASASIAGTPWWYVGQPERSNSANLYTLAGAGYVATLGPLTCPSSPSAAKGDCRQPPAPGSKDWGCIEEVTYSFQNLFSRSRPTWEGPERMVILADRSPVTLGSVRKQAQNPFLNSPNHAGKGQTVLYTDGSAAWLSEPMGSNGDNIWLPRSVEMQMLAQDVANRTGRPVILIGTEEPGAPGNVFLGP